MIPGLPGGLSPLNSPLEDLSEANGHDSPAEFVTEDVAKAVERAIQAGITWDRMPEALRVA